VLWETDTDFGPVTMVHIPRSQLTAIIHEYREPGNGFQVYVGVEGNKVDQCHVALGLVDNPDLEMLDTLLAAADCFADKCGDDTEKEIRAAIKRYEEIRDGS